MTERKRTIFEELNTFGIRDRLMLTIKFNAFFKDLGFERVNKNKSFERYTYYPEMTLMICPELILDDDDYLSEDNFLLKKSPTKTIIGRRSTLYENWHMYLSEVTKTGYNGMNTHSIIKRSCEEIKPLKIEYKGKELILGQYLKARNIVMLYVNPFSTNFGLEKNEFLDWFFKTFEEKMKAITLTKIDVTEQLKMAFVEKFKETVNNKLADIKDNLSSNERSIAQLQTSIIRTIRDAQLNRKQIDGLISFSVNTDDTIKKAIEELKQLPFVSNICHINNGIGLDVGNISINYNGSDIYIGDFYLLITPYEVKVMCKNPILNNENMEIFHPHINENHNCYGSLREQKIIEYLSMFDLRRLVFFVYMFLKTYTPEDCYNTIELWTRADIKRKKLQPIEESQSNLNVQFKGDYFRETSDRGERNDDNDNSDDEDEGRDSDSDYLANCVECGSSIYESDDYYLRNDDDELFCCRSCMEQHARENPSPTL